MNMLEAFKENLNSYLNKACENKSKKKNEMKFKKQTAQDVKVASILKKPKQKNLEIAI